MLPEEKKNTMENMTKEQANLVRLINEGLSVIRQKKMEYLACSADGSPNQEYFKGKADAYEYTYKTFKRILEWTASGSVAAPKEEEKKEERVFANIVNNPLRNWEEDYEHENGKYQGRCRECKEWFYGHKRRVICKICADATPDWEKMAQKKAPTHHEGWAWQGCWADGEMTGFARCMVQKVKPLESENTALREALKELIKFADIYIKSKVLEYARGNFEKSELEDSAAIIERARKLISK